MSSIRRLAGGLLLGLGLVAGATAQDAARAVVLRVVREPAPDLSRPLPRTLTDTRLPKFFDDERGRRGETFAVYWLAPGLGLPAGVTVLFEYRLAAAPELRTLHEQYDYKTQGERKVVFEIPEKDFREGGVVQTWRARIVYRGRLLAERAALDWK